MSRFIVWLPVWSSIAWLASAALAVSIPAEHLDPFQLPCRLFVTEAGPSRILEWDDVPGATFYRVGYRRCDGTIVGLAEVPATSFVHAGWNAEECLEYVVVAYDSTDNRICAAHAPNIGQCPCP